MATAESTRPILTAGGLLALAALVGAGAMAVAAWYAAPFIEQNEREDLLRGLNAVIPAAIYDNDILADTRELPADERLDAGAPITVFRARNGGRPVAAALTAVAPDGYSGPITLLVGIDHDGHISGVRVVKHRETPGLGDGIEARRGDWIQGFNGKSLSNPEAAGWKVKRDGGEFDQLTGATITPRAVVGAVYRSLDYFDEHRSEIFLPVEEEASP